MDAASGHVIGEAVSRVSTANPRASSSNLRAGGVARRGSTASVNGFPAWAGIAFSFDVKGKLWFGDVSGWPEFPPSSVSSVGIALWFLSEECRDPNGLGFSNLQLSHVTRATRGLV